LLASVLAFHRDRLMQGPTLKFGAAESAAAEQLIALALREDLADSGDLTSRALIPAALRGRVAVVMRRPGVLAGLPLIERVFAALDAGVDVELLRLDGQRVQRDDVVAEISGPTRALLSGERTVLNFLTALSGVATLTRRFVDETAGTRARIYDTRKTWPGWRVLQKYAVRCGGGVNHRMGLFDAVLIKDNHLAAWRDDRGAAGTLAAAVQHVGAHTPPGTSVEIEVDSLEQLADALQAAPEIVLLDNMDTDQIAEAVALRDRVSPRTELEASGGVSLEAVAAIARTGVERISVGALTHSAPALDIAFDWSVGAQQAGRA
jgi:nicotinate-nucleotide pyrophosphorylase (carboxylating)